jgi:hypothetical protein
MPHLARGGLCPVFDLRQQGPFNPDAAMRDALAAGLGFFQICDLSSLIGTAELYFCKLSNIEQRDR